MTRRDRLAAVVARELRTLVRTRSLLAVVAVFALVVVGVATGAVGAPGGYVSLTLDLLTAVEVLVPVLAFGLVYRSVRGDAERSELAVIRTYPLSRAEYVLGVFAGRALGVVAVVVATLGAAGLLASFGEPMGAGVLATHSAGDSPVVFVRFVALAALYAVAVSAVLVAASAVAGTTRGALATGVSVVLFVAVGLDLAIVGALSADLLQSGLPVAFGLSPASAFRGLVIELAVAPTLLNPPPVPAAAPAVGVAGLVGWTALSLATATVAVWE